MIESLFAYHCFNSKIPCRLCLAMRETDIGLPIYWGRLRRTRGVPQMACCGSASWHIARRSDAFRARIVKVWHPRTGAADI